MRRRGHLISTLYSIVCYIIYENKFCLSLSMHGTIPGRAQILSARRIHPNNKRSDDLELGSFPGRSCCLENKKRKQPHDTILQEYSSTLIESSHSNLMSIVYFTTELPTGHGSLFLDPTRPDPMKRWPKPTRDCRQKVWPDPTRGPSLPHMCIFNWIIIH